MIQNLLHFTNLNNEGQKRRQCQRKVDDRQVLHFLRETRQTHHERGRPSNNCVSLRMRIALMTSQVVNFSIHATMGCGVEGLGMRLVLSSLPQN